MKKLDDLVFKNLHGLRDEDDKAKHKHDNKSLDNFSSDPQQQQQQMTYNYYNNNYGNNMASQQYGNQGGMNQAYMQNMQQGGNQGNMGGMNNQNAYGMQQMNQFSHGNWNNAAQNQMQKIPSIPHPSQNPSFAQMNPMMQQQYVKMYQMAQLQMQQMKQAQSAYQNQGSFQNHQNTGNIQNTQSQYYQQSGGMGLNQGINSSFGNQSNFGSFTSNQNTNAQFDDGFADFQTSGNQRNQADDFDDFQGAPVPAATKANAKQQQFDEGFDDFQDASVTTAPQSTSNEPKNWDILDDFVEKKLPTQPQVAQNPAPQQMYGNMQNLTPQQAQYLQNQAIYQKNLLMQQQQQQHHQHQQNFGGIPAQQNANDDDGFEDFEEAKPSQVAKPKSPTKEDLMFGALESKVIKNMGFENIISHPTPNPTTVDDFGDFGSFSTSQPQPQNQNFAGGDDFQDFEDAGPTKPQQQNPHNQNPPAPFQEQKKLTIYDIDLAEFGITETIQAPHTTEPIKEQSLPEPPKQQHEDFGDFVEINEEKPPQSFGFGASQNQNELDFGYNNNQTEKKIDDWGFDNPSAPTNNDHHDFGDFEEPQAAAPQTNQPAADAFDDFQEVATSNQKEIGKSWEHIDFPPVESQPKETHDAGDFGDFEEHTSAPVQQAKEDEGFGDFDYPVPAATQNQETLFEEFPNTPAPPSHTQTEEKQNPNNAFDDFEEFSSPTAAAVQPQEVKKVEEQHDDGFGDFGHQEPQKDDDGFGDFGHQEHQKDDDGFGDFGNQEEAQKEASTEPQHKMQLEETTSSNPKQQVEKKLSVYDMDWAEFGIEDKNQNDAPPPMQFQFGGFEDKNVQDEKKTPVSGGLADLYSLYGNANATTPVAAEQGGEDPFGATGDIIQEEKQEDQDDFDDFEKPKPADAFDDFEAAPNPNPITNPKKEDDDGFAFDDQQQNQNHGHDDFADFGDFGAATPQESNKPQNQAFEDPFFFHQQEPQQHKEENLFGDFSAQPTKAKEEEAHHDDDFGGFEQDEAHHQEVFSDFQEPKRANPVEEQHNDDGFDDFADAGFDNQKQDEVETPVKSLSHIGGGGLYHDHSDFGSMNEVQHHHQPSAQHNQEENHDFNFKKKTSPTRERVHDDFGSFNDADQADNQSRDAPEPDHHHKDESILHRADSSDYTPQNKKSENDDFGDFVGSKQDLAKEEAEAEAERVPPSPPRGNFKYSLESVLSEFGIKAGHDDYTGEQEKNPFEEEIEKKIQEISQDFEEKLVKSTLMRAAVKKEKFKLNAEMVEELAQELKSLQKYKEAILTEGQIKIIAEIKELNQTKARLIDEDELEEAVKYKDLVKNKEKEQISKQKFEEFLSYYDNSQRKDYRLALLEELRAANVPNQFINYFYIRFLGGTIPVPLPQKEVVAEEPLVEDQPEKEETVEPTATAEVHEDQPAVVIPEAEEITEHKDDIQAEPEVEEQKPLEPEKEDIHIEQTEAESHPEEERAVEEQNEQVEVEVEVEVEKPSEEVQEQSDHFEEAQKPEETEDKKDESQEAHPESQPYKADEDVEDPKTEDETQKQQEEDFEDFGESEPVQKQDDGENDATEKVEENQKEVELEIEEKQEEVEVEENKPQEEQQKEDDGFGDFDDQPQEAKKSEDDDDFKFEEGEEKEKEVNVEVEVQGENKPQEEEQPKEDDDFGDFDDQPQEVKKPEEDDFKFEEGEENKQQEAQYDGFGDFGGQPQTTNGDFKFEEGEEKDQEEPKPQEEQDDGFGDFDDQPQEAKKPEEDDFKFDEAKNDTDNDGFGDFDGKPQADNNDFKFEEGEEKDREEPKPKEEQDDGFGDFDDKPQEAKKPEDNDDFKFDEAKDDNEDGFGDFDAQKSGDKDDFKFDDKEEKDDFEDFKKTEEEQGDGFGEFDDQTQEVQKPEAAQGDFDDEEEEQELKLEDIKVEEVPLTLEVLADQKRRITQWSLMVKVMFTESVNFNHNVRKILRQTIYEIYKFNKMTTAILQEKNKDAARAILSSQKFENYVAGVQILQSFCSELQRAFQFIEIGNKWFNKYHKAIQDLTQKVDGLKNQIREEFNKEFSPQLTNQKNSIPAEWLGEVQKLDKEALRHICHLSLRLNDSQLTEFSGNYYFLPYLNFLLNIE